MKIKTCKLTGRELDWAVAKARGFIDDPDSWLHNDLAALITYNPSNNWAKAAPIIEGEGISMFQTDEMQPAER